MEALLVTNKQVGLDERCWKNAVRGASWKFPDWL